MRSEPEPAHPPVDDPRLDAWRAFLQAHALVSRRLEADLAAGESLSLAAYDALAQLAIAGGRLRMSELADRVLLSRSGVTRLVDRLEADGLVVRRACSSDARGAEAVLTREGIERMRAAMPVHLRGVESYFLSRIDPSDLDVLTRAMRAVADGGWPQDCAEPALAAGRPHETERP